MRYFQVAALAVAVVLALALLAPTRAQGQGDDKDLQSNNTAYHSGYGVCVQPTMYIGSIVVGGNRCYNFYIVRDLTGVYLGFGPGQQLLVPRGQIVRLGTPRGASIVRQLLNLVPIALTTNIPMGTVQYTPVQLQFRGRQVILGVSQGGAHTQVSMAHER